MALTENIGTEEPKRGRRVTLQLTDAAGEEFDRLGAETGLNDGDMVRAGLNLMRQFVAAKAAGYTELRLIDDPNRPPSPPTQKTFF